jgi:hypothetical protein
MYYWHRHHEQSPNGCILAFSELIEQTRAFEDD